MRVETTYFAFDETEFDNEADCLAYEEKLNGLWGGVVFLDEEFRRPKPGADPVEFIQYNAIYVKVLDAMKAVELFQWLYGYEGLTMPPADMIYAGGVYKYDSDAPHDWVDLTERLREVTVEMDSIEKAVAKL